MHQDYVHNSSSAWNHAALQRRRGTAAVNIIALLQSMIHILVGRCSHSSCGREHEPLLCLQKERESGRFGFESRQVRQVLLMRWGWGLGQKPNYRHLTHEKVEAWMTRCTFPHLSFGMQKYFYYCEISRVTATSATELELEGSGGIQGDSQQFGWFANKAGDWDSVTSKMLRTSQ